MQHKVTLCSDFKRSYWESWNKTKECLTDFSFQYDVRTLQIFSAWPSIVCSSVCHLASENLLSPFALYFSLHHFQVYGGSCDREKDAWIPWDSDRTLGKLPLDIFVSNTQPFHPLKAGGLLPLCSSVEDKCFCLAHAQWKCVFASGGLLSGWRGFIQSFFFFLFGEVSYFMSHRGLWRRWTRGSSTAG